MAGGVKISVAFNDTTLAPSPTWTDITATDNLVAAYTIDRGRTVEFNRTDTGTATVSINDTAGLLDPTNSAGPYYGLLEPLLQIKIELWNPVTHAWLMRFRGFIDNFAYEVDPSTHQNAAGTTVGLSRLRLDCVDLFAILTAIEMQPDGSFGDTPPPAHAGNIFFDNATAHDRITQVLGNAGINSALYRVFTLNVYAAESTYSPGDTVLQVVEDAADADLPTVAVVYVTRKGWLAVHGRLAVFDPVGTAAGAGAAWDFTEWKAGDGKAVAASPTDTAQVRQFSYDRGSDKVYNYVLCTPQGISDLEQTVPTAMASQVKQDAVSIAQFGFRPWSAENLVIAAPDGVGINAITDAGAGILTGNSAVDETQAMGQFILNNYAEAHNRPTQTVIRSVDPSWTGAAATWKMLTEADIADVVELTMHGPGDSPAAYIFNGDPFLLLGLHEDVKPLNQYYADVTLSLDLAPIPADGSGLDS